MRTITDFGVNMERMLRDEFKARVAALPTSLGPADSGSDPSERTEGHGGYTYFYPKGFTPVLAADDGLEDLKPAISYFFPRGYGGGMAYVTYVGKLGRWVVFVDHSCRHLPVDDEGEVLGGRVLTELRLIGPLRITPSIARKLCECYGLEPEKMDLSAVETMSPNSFKRDDI